jgi:hypothetical protein
MRGGETAEHVAGVVVAAQQEVVGAEVERLVPERVAREVRLVQLVPRSLVGLEPAVLALGDWGVHQPMNDGKTSLSPVSVLIFLRSTARPGAGGTGIQIEMDDESWVVRSTEGAVTVTAGGSADVDAVVRRDPTTLNAMLSQPSALDTAIADGQLTVTGDLAALRALLT